MTDFPLTYWSVGLSSLKWFLTMTWEFTSARDRAAGIVTWKKKEISAVELKQSLTAGDFSCCLPKYSSSCAREMLLICFPSWQKFRGLFPCCVYIILAARVKFCFDLGVCYTMMIWLLQGTGSDMYNMLLPVLATPNNRLSIPGEVQAIKATDNMVWSQPSGGVQLWKPLPSFFCWTSFLFQKT